MISCTIVVSAANLNLYSNNISWTLNLDMHYVIIASRDLDMYHALQIYDDEHMNRWGKVIYLNQIARGV